MACTCIETDSLAAKRAIQKGIFIAELVDDSHFMASIRQCILCDQKFLTIFCERVDWADGDDPQVWLAAPISEDESKRLSAVKNPPESMLIETIGNERRWICHDMPKGAPATLEWKTGRFFIPAHD